MPLNFTKQYIGCDIWRIHIPPQTFFTICKQHKIEIYKIQYKEDIVFHASILLRFRILKVFDSIQYVKSYGILSLISHIFTIPRIFMITVCTMTIILLSNHIFKIEYHGSMQGKELIEQVLQKDYGHLPYYHIDSLKIEEQLKSHFAWIDFQKKGSVLEISYIEQQNKNKNQQLGNKIIAKKDGIISHYEIYSGVKQVEINQSVKKGDVLVDQYVLDTKQKKHKTKVEGKVFAKTWEEIIVRRKGTNKNPFLLFQMILYARNQLYDDFSKDDSILKENILHFRNNKGTIELYVHYELLQNIAVIQE